MSRWVSEGTGRRYFEGTTLPGTCKGFPVARSGSMRLRGMLVGSSQELVTIARCLWIVRSRLPWQVSIVCLGWSEMGL
jgi:hypothetical protein